MSKVNLLLGNTMLNKEFSLRGKFQSNLCSLQAYSVLCIELS